MSDEQTKSKTKWIWITALSLLGIVVILIFIAIATFENAMHGLGNRLTGLAESIFPLRKN